MIINEKDTLRKAFRLIRDTYSKDFISEISSAACKNIAELEEFKSASTVLLYFPINNELSPLSLLPLALKMGKRVAFPVCDHESGTLTFKEIHTLDKLKAAKFGLFEPSESCQALTPDKNTLCIVPAIAFSTDGNRLGYGKGFYDRFLKDFKGASVGLVHSELLVPYLPRDEHDTPICTVATEKEIFKI